MQLCTDRNPDANAVLHKWPKALGSTGALTSVGQCVAPRNRAAPHIPVLPGTHLAPPLDQLPRACRHPGVPLPLHKRSSLNHHFLPPPLPIRSQQRHHFLGGAVPECLAWIVTPLPVFTAAYPDSATTQCVCSSRPLPICPTRSNLHEDRLHGCHYVHAGHAE